jgi:hypothetical protein
VSAWISLNFLFQLISSFRRPNTAVGQKIGAGAMIITFTIRNEHWTRCWPLAWN